MSKVTDIDGAFEDRIRSDWSAKELLDNFNIVREGRYDAACSAFCDDELSQCHICKSWFDDPKDTAYVIDADTDEEYSICQECHTKLNRNSESQQAAP